MNVITFKVTTFKDENSKVISFLALYSHIEASFEVFLLPDTKKTKVIYGLYLKEGNRLLLNGHLD